MATQDSSNIPQAQQQKEEWRDVPGWEGYYQVSNLGRVRSLNRTVVYSGKYTRKIKGKLISPYDRKGYLSVILWRNSKAHPKTIHQLVARVFIGPCPRGKQVNHKSGIKTDNRPGNLEYVTPGQNLRHAIENGLSKSWRGRKNPRSVLAPNDVHKIRKMHETGDYYLRELAEEYGVTIQSIWAIVKYKTWTHI